MPAKLDREDGSLLISLSGMDKLAFQDALMKVRSMPGRRYDPDHPKGKVWVIPDTPDNLMKVVYSIQPTLTAEVKAIVRQAQAQVADDLVNRLPADADLTVPWADRLYQFQRAMVGFAIEHPKLLICDEMGLGKTVEAITAIYELAHRARPDFNAKATIGAPNPGLQLVIAPNNVLGKWVTEYGDWVEGGLGGHEGGRQFEPIIIDGKTPAKRQAQLDQAVTESGVAIVNWEKLGSTKDLRHIPRNKDTGEPESPSILAQVEWDAIIADEIHRAKNRKAAQSMTLHKLQAPVQLGLTGTPLMTQPDDLWSILHWLDPVTYSSFWRFFHEYTDAYQGYKGYVVIGVKNPDALRFELGDKLVRRTKSQVGIELPDKTTEFREIPMKPAQATLYERSEKDFFFEVERAINVGELTFEDMEAALEAGDVERAIRMIPNGAARFSLMRQVAVSPALVGEKDESGILDAAVEIVKDNPGKQFVVWTWHKAACELVAHRLRKLKPSVIAEPYHGDVERKRRDELADRFQAGDIQVLCVNIAAGREGIDLFAADTAIFVERATTATMNEQAEARLHRIGQVNAVTIIVLGSADTVQTGRIAELNRLREMMSAAILGRPE